LLTGDASQLLQKSSINQVILTNSIEHQNLPSKFTVLDVSSVFAHNLSQWQ
jgi:phosphoribosylpyrophosphate synthetase